jgi:hypothetical protein
MVYNETIPEQRATVNPEGNEMAMVKLFHGSTEVIAEILSDTNWGVDFGGLFASQDHGAAASHGNGCIHVMQIDDQQIGNSSDLRYTWDSVPAERRAMIKAIKSHTNAKNKAQVERVFALAADDVNPQDADWNLYKGVDCFASASFMNQRIRGKIAKACGFKAIEMDDEHGVSYLVFGGMGVEIALED